MIDDDELGPDYLAEVRPGEFKRLGDLTDDEKPLVADMARRARDLHLEMVGLIDRLTAFSLDQGRVISPPNEVVQMKGKSATFTDAQRAVDAMRATLEELGAP